MAAGVTGKAATADTQFAEIVEAMVLQELRPAMTSREFLRFASGGPSSVATFGLWSDLGAAAAPGGADLSDISNTAITDTSVSATAAEVGFRVDVGDLAREINVTNLYSEMSAYVARSVAEKWETDLAALMDDFTNITSAASTLTPTDVLTAVSALEQRDIPGPYVGYFDPKQTGELRQEIATSTATLQTGGEMVRPFGDSGWFGTFMGLPIWQTSLVVTTSGLVGGAVFASGQALGCYELWGNRVETQRDASARTMEFVGTQCYGFAEISDTRGQTVKSVA